MFDPDRCTQAPLLTVSALSFYSQAIEDFKLAEQRGFVDLYTLMVARGNTYRQLDMPAEALTDFINASDLLGSSKKVILAYHFASLSCLGLP